MNVSVFVWVCVPLRCVCPCGVSSPLQGWSSPCTRCLRIRSLRPQLDGFTVSGSMNKWMNEWCRSPVVLEGCQKMVCASKKELAAGKVTFWIEQITDVSYSFNMDGWLRTPLSGPWKEKKKWGIKFWLQQIGGGTSVMCRCVWHHSPKTNKILVIPFSLCEGFSILEYSILFPPVTHSLDIQ